MSKRPTGTSLEEARLLELRTAPDSTESSLAVEVTPLVGGDATDEGAAVDWETDEREGVPALVLGPIDEEEIPRAVSPRRLHWVDDEILAPVPDRLVSAEPPDGLGLDLDGYDDDNPLLFEGLSLEAAGVVVPARYGDGTPYAQEPLPDVPSDSDPVAQAALDHEVEGHPAPNPETLDAPIDAELVRDAIRTVEAPYPDVSAVLEEVHRRGLVSEADTVTSYPPLTVDGRAVCVVRSGTWSDELASRLESEVADDTDDRTKGEASEDRGGNRDSALDAAKRIHERQAERLIEAADATEYRDALSEYEVVVTDERETAEWEVAEPGVSR